MIPCEKWMWAVIPPRAVPKFYKSFSLNTFLEDQFFASRLSCKPWPCNTHHWKWCWQNILAGWARALAIGWSSNSTNSVIWIPGHGVRVTILQFSCSYECTFSLSPFLCFHIILTNSLSWEAPEFFITRKIICWWGETWHEWIFSNPGIQCTKLRLWQHARGSIALHHLFYV